MNTRLNFINCLVVLAKANVIVLPDELVPNLGEIAMARRAVRDCGSVCSHPFFYADDQEVILSGDWVSNKADASLAGTSSASSARSWKAKS